MSITNTILGTLGSVGQGLLQTVLIKNQWQIGDIVPDVVITESKTDRRRITSHPVEYSPATITDHSYDLPSEIVMKIGFTDCGADLQGALLSGDTQQIADIFTQSKVNDSYQSILDLASSGEPFDVITQKRTYSNMLIEMVRVDDDNNTDSVLFAEISMREVQIAYTQSTSLPPLQQQLVPEDTASPDQTQPVQAIEDKSKLLRLKEQAQKIPDILGIP